MQKVQNKAWCTYTVAKSEIVGTLLQTVKCIMIQCKTKLGYTQTCPNLKKLLDLEESINLLKYNTLHLR